MFGWGGGGVDGTDGDRCVWLCVWVVEVMEQMGTGVFGWGGGDGTDGDRCVWLGGGGGGGWNRWGTGGFGWGGGGTYRVFAV